jgi:prepilin-type N-terminal cleavage/methylation domain-containing protein
MCLARVTPPSTLSCVNHNKSNISNKNQGFSLVELSIVLLIIGLLVSGVMVGQDMIRAAELRSITTEKDQIQTAVTIFNGKYDALPGDMNNATAFWGTMTGGGGCSTTAAGATTAVGTQTCNGNGDGVVNIMSGTSGNNPEHVIFWQHLSNASLIAGKYSGVWSGTWGEDGENYKSKSGNNSWFHAGNIPIARGYTNGTVPLSETDFFEGVYGNSLSYRNHKGIVSTDPLKPTEAWNIDKKLDDGLPGVGNIVTLERDGVNCNTLAADAKTPAASYTYNLNHTGNACNLEFKNMW